MEKTLIDSNVKTITNGTDEDGKSFVSNDGITITSDTDDFDRTTQVKTSSDEDDNVYLTDYEYADGAEDNSTTNLVSKLTQTYAGDEIVSYSYEYDANGNITKIYEDGELAHQYKYDSLNQLKEEYDYINRFYINYSYDSAGNIYSANRQTLDARYDYPTGTVYGNVYYYNDDEWCDKLTGVNGDTITYDESGNPLSYRDDMTFTWENGRQLATITTADNSIELSYNSSGMRTQKTVDDVETNYYYDSDNNLIGMTANGKTMLFYYDADGSVTSFKYNGNMYYYVKNLQGDIVKIINQSGVVYASYVYDAWGNIQSETGQPIVRSLNPFRYRGYVYDEETGLYYLQSRYYDPETGRFLNADDLGLTILSIDSENRYGISLTNVFEYCYNNPVNFSDEKGYVAVVDDVAAVLIFLALLSITSILCSWMSTSQFRQIWTEFCNVVGNGLSSIWSTICNGASSVWDWSTKKIKNATKAIKQFNTAIKAVSEVRTKLKKERKNSKRYYTITFNKNDVPKLGIKLTYLQAQSKLRQGKDVITYYKSDARKVANAVGSVRSKCDPQHKGAASFKHFHVKYGGIKWSIHSFYIGV